MGCIRNTNNLLFERLFMMLRQLLSVAAGAMLLSTPVLMSTQAQAAPSGDRTEKSAQWKQFRKELNLTEAQKAQLKQIRTETRAQMEGILTDSQKAQIKTMKESRGQGDRQKGGWKQLGLTENQKNQLKKIREEAKAKSDLIFTPEQKELMKKHRSQFKRNGKTAGTTWDSTDPMNVR
jgi:periplasmic protein CpxP/Spy